MSQKKRVLVIVGGKSGEHEVSVRSGTAIADHLDPEKYVVTFLGITKQGEWVFNEQMTPLIFGGEILSGSKTSLADVRSNTLQNHPVTQLHTPPQLSPDQFDIVFPAIHGTNGEDGRLQGLLEMANMPYVGSGVLGSAVAMDKVIQKTLCQAHNLPQVAFVHFIHQDWKLDQSEILRRIKTTVSLPLFVKPANLGSSVGVVKVKKWEDLPSAITEAAQFDSKIIVEAGVENIKEIEVSILGNDVPIASVCGAIIPHTEFYDYETKYLTDDIDVEIPAKIPDHISKAIQETAIQAFKILNCRGLARIDFFYQPATEKFYLNELNTMPGFTSISMYPKLWEASGVSFSELVDRLIELGLEDWQVKQSLQYSYQVT